MRELYGPLTDSADKGCKKDHATLERMDKIAGKNRAKAGFEVIAREWADINDLWSDKHHKRVIESLEKDISPLIGDRPITEIEPPDVLAAIRRVDGLRRKILRYRYAQGGYDDRADRAYTSPIW